MTAAGRAICDSFCPNCYKPVAAWTAFRQPPGRQQVPMEQLMQRNEMLSEMGWGIEHVWPEKQVVLAPDHLPAEVSRVFIQAEGCARRRDNDAAAVMYRRCVELALKDKAPAAAGTLAKRIEDYRDSGGITAEVAQWAHLVRLIANEAAHDPGEPTDEDVTDLASFARVFLEYVYTLPERVRVRLARQP